MCPAQVAGLHSESILVRREQPPGDQYLIASHGQTCSSHLNGPEEKSNWSDLRNNLQCTL